MSQICQFAHVKGVTVILSFLLFCATFSCKAESESCFVSICEFTLAITESRSMIFTTEDGEDAWIAYDVKLEDNGTLKLAANRFHFQVPNISITPEMVHTVDGSEQRNIILINGQFPGPTLEVMEGAEVAIRVINKLEKEALAIHWHGIHMRNNVWMDGVPFVTQCPIFPRQSFTYRFIADPPGTHWYHSHNELQRMDGLFGAMIIHRSKERDLMPYFSMVINDWFPVPSTEIQLLDPFSSTNTGTGKSLFNPIDLKGASFDGVKVSSMDYWSGLINGRGRKGNNTAPLTVFTAIQGKRHQAHIVSASGEFAYRVSIDEHELTVIESDGHPVEATKFESVIVFPGERYVVEFEANLNPGRYWIRASSLRMGYGYKNPQPDGVVWDAKAILQYEGTSDNIGDPKSHRKNCTSETGCKILNCAWPAYRHDQFPNMQCVDVSELRLDSSRYHGNEGDVLLDNKNADVELFLNLVFPIGSSINSRRMIMPSAPLFQDPSTWGLVPCSRDCEKNGCRCSNIVNLPANKTVQLVLMSDIFGGLQAGTNFGSKGKAHHPMHLHGNSFRVLKIGYPVVDNITGKILGGSEDIACDWRKDKTCSHPYWVSGGAPGLNFDNPPSKDTVIVPAMGYTVVRFQTNNPGYWLFHCHVMLHHFEGMMLLFNVSHEHHPPVPRGFPTCQNFDISHDEFRKNLVEGKRKGKEGAENCGGKNSSDEDEKEVNDKVTLMHVLSAIAAGCSSLGVLLQVALLVLLFKLYKRTGTRTPKGNKLLNSHY